VPRVVSFLVLLAIVLLIGSVFFQVMAKFLLPLFLAAVLVVIFKPLHQWTTAKLPNRPHLSALATTAVILLIVLVPSCWLGWKSFAEVRHVFNTLQDDVKRQELVAQFNNRTHQFKEFYENTTGTSLDVKAVLEQATSKIGAFLISSAQTLLGLLVGTAIMALALYYFLADGPAMIRAVMQLSPLDEAYEKQLLEKFSDISRAVVLATLLSAVLQGLAASVGYFFALPSDAPIVLLTAVTMVCAIIPFVGATAVWLPVCIYIALYGERIVDGQEVMGNWPRAVVLAIYCAGFVSTLDNFVKPWVLHGQANLHPLLALLSVIGGVQALGPIGILVGPMIVAFLQALLNMLNQELRLLGKDAEGLSSPGKLLAAAASESPAPASPAPASPAPVARHKKHKQQ
jgi:predicted PurR-regulated permease PerM